MAPTGPTLDAPMLEATLQPVDDADALQRIRIMRLGARLGIGHSRTSIAWPMPSLVRLKHIDVRKIMTPGRAATTGFTQIAGRRLFSIRPHSGFGGLTPSPRKLRPDARMMLMLIRL